MERPSGYLVAKILLQRYESEKISRRHTPEELAIADKVYGEYHSIYVGIA